MTEIYALSVNTKPETRDRLDRLADASRRSRSYHVNEAIERYLDEEESFVARVNARLREADDGEFISTGELRKRFTASMQARFGLAGSWRRHVGAPS